MKQKKNSNKKFFMGLTVALLLPLSFFVIAKVLHKDELAIPKYYNIASINTNTTPPDTIYKKVGDIVLQNQMGDVVSLNKDLKGKMLLIEVFFTKCGSICPKLTHNVSHFLLRAFRKNDTTVHFVSITIDPDNDSVAALKAYSEQYEVNPDHWWFLTGDKSKITDYLHNQLLLMTNPSSEGIESLDHTSTLVLIDKQRYVRGYYNGLDTAELKRCADDIGLILMQKKKQK